MSYNLMRCRRLRTRHAVSLVLPFLLLLTPGWGTPTVSTGLRVGGRGRTQRRWARGVVEQRRERRASEEPVEGEGGVLPRHTRRALDETSKNCSWSPASEESYFGGPVLTGGINVYLIFYGNWSETACGPRVIKGLIDSLSTPLAPRKPSLYRWWQVLTKYCDSNGKYITQQVAVKGVTYDRYSQGSVLLRRYRGLSGVWHIVHYNLAEQKVPRDPKGVYLVLTSPDVRMEDDVTTCDSYCGWHDSNSFRSKQYPFAVVFDPSVQCRSAPRCLNNLGNFSRDGAPPRSPNRCFGADSMASTILHELAELATNPFGSGWDSPLFRPGSHENGDLCQTGEYPGLRWSKRHRFAWNARGTGGLRFLVQSIYDPQKASCSMGP